MICNVANFKRRKMIADRIWKSMILFMKNNGHAPLKDLLELDWFKLDMRVCGCSKAR